MPNPPRWMTLSLLLAAFSAVASYKGSEFENFEIIEDFVNDVHGIRTYVLYNNETLKRRNEISTTNASENIQMVDSYNDVEYQRGYISGKWLLFYRDSWLTLNGTGYFRIRWEPYYWEGSERRFMPPTFTVNDGEWLEVAGGGTYDNTNSKCSYFTYNEMNSTVSYNFDNGTYWNNEAGDKMDLGWQNKYYYLDGSVTILHNERRTGYPGAYNLAMSPWLYDDIVTLRTVPYGYLIVYDKEDE